MTNVTHPGTFGDKVRENEMNGAIEQWQDASIHVKDGEAVVRGRVPSDAVREKIIQIVAKLPGVKTVDCQVTVDQPQ